MAQPLCSSSSTAPGSGGVLAPAARPAAEDGPALPRCEIQALVARTSRLLASGVPLTLLLDLADPAGPRSREHYHREGGDPALVRAPGLATAG